MRPIYVFSAVLIALFAIGPTDGIAPLERQTFATVDFNGLLTLDCDWDIGSCTLIDEQVKFCVKPTLSGCF